MRAHRIKQRDTTDCGAACLASVCSYYGLRLSVARIRQLAFTDMKGTNVAGMIDAAKALGLEARGVRGDVSNLPAVPKPVIAHVVLPNGLHHYVVVYKTSRKIVCVMDPASGTLVNYKLPDFKKIWSGVLVLLMPSPDFVKGTKSPSLSSRVRLLLKPHKATVIQAVAGALVYTILGLSTSIFVQKIVDHVMIDQNRSALNMMGVVMLAILCIRMFIGTMKSLLMLRTGQLMDCHLILGYYKHLLNLPLQFFNSMRVGEIISRMNDAVKIRTFINDVSVNIIVNVFVFVFSFLLMFTYYWKLALIMTVIIPLYGIVYAIMNLINKRVERRLMENTADLESQLVGSLSSIRTIKSFGLEDHSNLKTEIKFVSLLRTVYSSGLNAIYSGSVTDFISQLFIILLLWGGAIFVLERHITPGELLSFYALLAFFIGPANSLIGMNKLFQNARIAADRLFEIMDLEHADESNKLVLQRSMVGDVRFTDVSFRYGSREEVLKDFSLTIQHGKVTAIVGESGSGKSTVASILLKLFPLTSGNVSIGDTNIDYILTDSLRKMVAVVPQDIHLVGENIIENIAVGDFEPDMKKILTISSTLGILEFVEKLPMGFSTNIGENGVCLSGGQRQRLAIARALYRDPEILILDEATSSLDPVSEGYVQRMIDILRLQGKTVLVIAHRLTTVMTCDKIAVVHRGKIAEEGTHDELIQREGAYYALWKQQFPLNWGTAPQIQPFRESPY